MANNLRLLRTVNHLSAEQAANIAGVSKNTYWLYEKEAISPALKYLIRLADYYHVTLDGLAGREPLPGLETDAYRERMANDETAAYELYLRAEDRQGIKCMKSLSEFPFPERVELVYPYNMLYDAVGGYNRDILVRPLTERQKTALEGVLDSLPPVEKEILLGIYKYRLKQAEVAERVGNSVSWMQAQKIKALETVSKSYFMPKSKNRNTV